MPDSDTTTAAASPSWEERLAGLQTRKVPEVEVVIRDDASIDAVNRTALALADVRVEIRSSLAHSLTEPGMTSDTLTASVEAHADVTAARDVHEAALQAADDASVTFLFRKLPAHVYEALTGQHPPTPSQLDAGQRVNSDTYIPALIAACSVGPVSYRTAFELIHGTPVESADDPFDLTVERTESPLNHGETSLLYAACVRANEGTESVVPGKGWSTIPG